jgi:type IV secretion system protein VirB11
MMRPFDPFLNDPLVTEVLTNEPFKLWAKTFDGWIEHDVPALTPSFLKAVANTFVTYNNLQLRGVNYVVLPDGQRGTIIQPPAAHEGMFGVIIRKHMTVARTLEELTAEGAFSDWRDKSFHKPSAGEASAFLDAADFTRLEPFEVELLALKREGRIVEFLERCVHYKRNIMIAGKTGSGKTTFARSLIEKVPTTERILTIEDVHELMLPSHPNKLHLMYGDAAGRITAREALAACMRASPDRIFLAELRGNEAWEYIASLNTGHPGSISTVHADNAVQTFARISTLILSSEVGQVLPADMVRQELLQTINVTLHFHERKLTEVFYDPIFAKSKLV